MRVHLQRSTPGNAICVLLRNDGQFHLETAHGNRTQGPDLFSAGGVRLRDVPTLTGGSGSSERPIFAP